MRCWSGFGSTIDRQSAGTVDTENVRAGESIRRLDYFDTDSDHEPNERTSR